MSKLFSLQKHVVFISSYRWVYCKLLQVRLILIYLDNEGNVHLMYKRTRKHKRLSALLYTHKCYSSSSLSIPWARAFASSVNKKNGKARNMSYGMDYYIASSNDSNQNDDVFVPVRFLNKFKRFLLFSLNIFHRIRGKVMKGKTVAVYVSFSLKKSLYVYMPQCVFAL